jgi:FkbM family methyltransferase
VHVEECCQAILVDALPGFDPKRTGWCIDVGVGDFAFYCQTFAHLGYQSAAIEPLPVAKLRTICAQYRIRLVEAALSEHDGSAPLHLGIYADRPNTNMNTLRPDWWGATASVVQVQVMKLHTLLASLDARVVTCLKMDVEGMEPAIIRQLPDLPTRLLPRILQFEYGGGAERGSGQAGWSAPHLAEMLQSLQIVRDCGYKAALVMDGTTGTPPRWLDLQTAALDVETVFEPHARYGNIMCFCEAPDVAAIDAICRPYTDLSTEPPLLLSSESLFRRVLRRVLSYRGRQWPVVD